MQQLPGTTKSPLIVDCAREILDAVPPVMRFIRRQMRSHRGGLSLAQFRSLVRVNQPPQATLSSVAEHLGATMPTTSRIVAGLVEKGLVDRQDCRWDRRQVLFELTPRGRDVLQTARKAAQKEMEVELEKLNSPQCKSLINATKIFKIVFGPALDGARDAARRNPRRSRNTVRR
jgi:DNA-binding MarR family transcriptional regulator